MSRLRWHLITAVSVLLLLLSACGDESIEGEPGREGAPNSTECSPGQAFNPISGRCVTVDSGDPGGGGTNPGGQNPGGTNPGGTNPGDTNPGDTNPGGTDPGDTNPGDTNPGGQNPPEEQPCGDGSILGKTCSPDGAVLAAATVTISGHDCEGVHFEITTTTDSEGLYTLNDVPAGEHDLTVTSGSFTTSRTVGVRPGEATDMRGEAQKVCLENNVPIAVVRGDWDNVGNVLRSIDLEYDTINTGIFGAGDAGSFLTDYSRMSQYQILFFECGTLWDDLTDSFGCGFLGMGSCPDISLIKDNIRRFIQDGKSIYASDWAHPFINEAFPEAVQFLNEPQGPSGARQGVGNQTVQSEVISPEMLTLLGRDTAEVNMDLSEWVVATAASQDSQVHFRGDIRTMGGSTIPNAPLMISYTPPGTNGKLIYTSFHNSAQGSSMGSDMHDILRFMIFQL